MPGSLHRWGAPLRNLTVSSTSQEKGPARLAFTKLSLFFDRNRQPDTLALEAALVCRLYLGIERTSIGTDFASKLVASRMATALYVDESRTFMAACYSVDPILAWAAFQIVICFNADAVLAGLTGLTKNGLIERSPRGGLITKFTVMSAYDRALRRRFNREASIQSYQDVSAIPHFSAVSLKEILANLSGRFDLLDTLDTTNSVHLRALEGCTTVLAQWTGSQGHETTINVNLAVRAMLTHCGVQMPPNMPGIDHMLVFCKDEKQRIEASNLVVMLFQSKNRSRFETVKVPQRIVDRFTHKCVPVIFILHEVDQKGCPFKMERDEESVSPLGAHI